MAQEQLRVPGSSWDNIQEPLSAKDAEKTDVRTANTGEPGASWAEVAAGAGDTIEELETFRVEYGGMEEEEEELKQDVESFRSMEVNMNYLQATEEQLIEKEPTDFTTERIEAVKEPTEGSLVDNQSKEQSGSAGRSWAELSGPPVELLDPYRVEGVPEDSVEGSQGDDVEALRSRWQDDGPIKNKAFR